LIINQNGTALTVTEPTPASSRQWKYSTVRGGPYTQTIAGATGISYIPNFPDWGTYFVVCESTKGAVVYTSNEVIINVPVFSEQTGSNIIGLEYGSVVWGDYDNDGDLDILISSERVDARIYRNDNGIFTDINAGLAGRGPADWGDYDNDGDLDILLTGDPRIYRNDNGVFTDISATLPSVSWGGSVAWGDYDNDGDLDIFLAGGGNSGAISKICQNDNGVFTDINAELTGVYYSSVAWGDYDNDGDLDLLLTGYNNEWVPISKLYRNDGGAFTDILAGLAGASEGSVAWGDYDNDGDLDILLTGYDNNYIPIAKIYRNDNGVFPDINAGLMSIASGSAAWGDYDNDGDLDILLSGYNSTAGIISKIYRNDSGVFNDINAGLRGVRYCSLAWGDYDNDSDLDILMGGQSSSGYFTYIYRNNITSANTIPATPSNLQATLGSNKVTLSWNKSTDSKTPQNGLTYNLYIGKTPATVNRKSPMASLPDGYRRIVQNGKIQKNTWPIKNLPAGTYYWSVQAIDNSFAGSAFASEGTFTVPFSNSISPVAEQILAINQNGVGLTVAESPAPASRQWKYSTVRGGPYNQTITVATGTSYLYKQRSKNKCACLFGTDRYQPDRRPIFFSLLGRL
jgi:predicted nucleotidyltransferase